VVAELEDPYDAWILEEGQRLGLPQEVVDRAAQRVVTSQHLGRDQPFERQVLELEDLAAAAAPQSFDGPEPLERGKQLVVLGRSGGHRREGEALRRTPIPLDAPA
jgi:hypothetical protein